MRVEREGEHRFCYESELKPNRLLRNFNVRQPERQPRGFML